MVLKLKEICLNFIAKNHSSIANFDHSLINTKHKEILIERMINFNLLKLNKNDLYETNLIKNFFNCSINTLKFESTQQLDDSFVSKIVRYSNNFTPKNLSIDKCHHITDQGIHDLLVKLINNLDEIKINYLNISLSKSLRFIKSLKLTSIDLSNCSMINDDDLWTLCKNNSNLKILKLTYCSKITNSGVRNALNFLNKLELLDLEGIHGIGTGFYTDYTQFTSINFKNIKNLTFCGSNEIQNSKSMKKLFENCIQLKELNILYSTNFNQTTNQTDTESPLNYLPKSLVSLSLYRPNLNDSNILLNAIKRLNNLTQLSLYSVECLNDKCLIDLLESIGFRLTHLNLGGYMTFQDRFSSESIKYIGIYCKQLKSLSFELFSLTNNLNSIRNLFESKQTSLNYEKINLSACRGISYDLLIQIGLNCKNLISLDLSGMNDLVDDNLIETIAFNLNRLEYFDIKACVKVTDYSIICLVVKCPIKILVLAGLSLLTDKSIFAISNHLQYTLKEIYLSGCSRISQVALNYLSDCCINRIYCQHHVPNADPNLLMAKNLDTGNFERVDLI